MPGTFSGTFPREPGGNREPILKKIGKGREPGTETFKSRERVGTENWFEKYERLNDSDFFLAMELKNFKNEKTVPMKN